MRGRNNVVIDSSMMKTPRAAQIVNQFTSARFVRALIAVVLLIAFVTLLVLGRTVPDVLFWALGTALGFYYGVDVPNHDKPRSTESPHRE